MNRNYSDISYAESPFGTLSEFMSKTFGWMFAGLLVTFLVGIGAVMTGLIYPLITSGLFILTSIAELVLVFVLSARVQTLQPSTATGIFFADFGVPRRCGLLRRYGGVRQRYQP